jgi:hypothetical protein
VHEVLGVSRRASGPDRRDADTKAAPSVLLTPRPCRPRRRRSVSLCRPISFHFMRL